MAFRKTFWTILFVLVLGAVSTSPVKAQTPAQDFVNQAQSDYKTLANFMNGPFSKSLGFFSTLGWDNPPGVFDFVMGPHFEIGVGAGADFITLPNLNSLSLPAIVANSNISFPSGIPLPFPIATARLGLMNGLDIGFRYTTLPSISVAGVSANYSGWGLDLRYKILDGIQLPTVTMGISWDQMNGNVGLASNINQNSIYTDSGQQYNVNVSGKTAYDLNWNSKSFGAKIEVGKDLGVVYPFAAIGFQRNSGVISTTLTGNGNYTLTTNPGGVPSGSGSLNLLAVSAAPPTLLEPKFVVGLDFGVGLHWAIVGESNGTDIAGSTSFRVQF